MWSKLFVYVWELVCEINKVTRERRVGVIGASFQTVWIVVIGQRGSDWLDVNFSQAKIMTYQSVGKKFRYSSGLVPNMATNNIFHFIRFKKLLNLLLFWSQILLKCQLLVMNQLVAKFYWHALILAWIGIQPIRLLVRQVRSRRRWVVRWIATVWGFLASGAMMCNCI